MKKQLMRIASFCLALLPALTAAPLGIIADTTGEDPLAGFAGKKLSILGDSISTYRDYSNGTAADTTNSTIRSGAIYYPNSLSLAVTDTWWYQIAEKLDMELLVNNAWSGSCMHQTRSGTVGAYLDRCVQLHDDTGDLYGGT